MQKIIMIKYGELTTKKDNKGLFLTTLKRNVENSLKNLNVEVSYDSGRMFVNPLNDNYDEVLNKLEKVFGIHELNIVYKIENDYEILKKELVDILKEKDFKTFKVSTKRSNKNFEKTSMEVSKELGAVVLKNLDKKEVDVHTPDLTINVEIRMDNFIVYFNKIEGAGGYPVGTLGKGLLMLSGGIDSPVAGYLVSKRGVRLEAIYFESPPHTSLEAKNKVISLAKKLSEYNGNIKLHVINFTNIQESIYKNIPNDYLITIMRRMMYRIGEQIANYNKCKILVNGESIGQVASQTLTSISAINSVITMPVIRPVACFDKLEIIDIANKIDTYKTSILPFEDCCTIFVPTHPVINPDIEKCVEYEKLIDYEELIKDAIKEHEIINVNNNVNEFEDIL
ncbi:MAG: tRNA 4-thiouridine(8) synthase ThiI [Firmicutes bacterium]|nr:tRNA 4-thiouridine(8) synthase ThiI [Bacillota bacterium]